MVTINKEIVDPKHQIPLYLIFNYGTIAKSTDHHYAWKYQRHLVLAQHLVDNQLFLDGYNKMRLNSPDGWHRLILDNGAYEDQLCDMGEYLTVVHDLKPDVVILPDLPGIRASTSRKRSLKFMELLRRYTPHLLEDGMQVMYCPQGAGYRDVMDEFVWACGKLYNDPGWLIGIGKCHEYWQGRGERGRMDMVEAISRITHANQCRFHLLGMRWDTGFSDPKNVTYPNYPNIIGMDTTKATKCALEHKVFPDKPEVIHTMDSPWMVDEPYLIKSVDGICDAWNQGLFDKCHLNGERQRVNETREIYPQSVPAI